MEGLVHAVLLDGRGGARTLDWEGVCQWEPSQGLLWVHLDYTADASSVWLYEQKDVPALVSDALLAQETRPRVTMMQEGLLVYLRGVNLNPGAEPEDMIAIRLWVTPGRVISTQRRQLRAVSSLLARADQGDAPGTSYGLLVELVDDLTWNMEDVVDQVEEQVGEYEEAAMQRQSRAMLGEMSLVRRRVTVLRRFLAPQRDALARLVDPASPLSDRERGQLREVADRLQRLLEDLDAAREHALIAQEDLSNRLADALNQRMYVLAIVSIIFLPMGFLTGLMGVNLGGMPGAESHNGFMVFATGLLIIGLVMAVVLKRWKWL
ncbi:magnesium transporter [Isoalcanivorax pacificus W11-5]|uniref:Magnesium transporter n=1 Tax=Isoalcanivorax pacificus W11-5 TaxID=391936 RepID=A0A0B4XPJ0_9GAMM|nr:zinc transporter ZntB [Isoalcanivorax pacificus]AJD48368.1 magnesium transporter [Isoalcanivorax pacificus W11-5]